MASRQTRASGLRRRWALPAAQRRKHFRIGTDLVSFQPLPFDGGTCSDQQNGDLALAAVVSGGWVAPAMDRPSQRRVPRVKIGAALADRTPAEWRES